MDPISPPDAEIVIFPGEKSLLSDALLSLESCCLNLSLFKQSCTLLTAAKALGIIRSKRLLEAVPPKRKVTFASSLPHADVKRMIPRIRKLVRSF